MEIKTFIEKAIEGGCESITDGLDDIHITDSGVYWGGEQYKTIEEVLIDPKAWEAVGKVEGWNGREYFSGKYKRKMHSMIDHLIAGNDIESYIKTL